MIVTKEFTNEGVCSKGVSITYDDETRRIKEIKFLGGCPGNTVGVAMLCKGMTIDEVVKSLSGISCRGSKGGQTSCPNELAKHLATL